MQDVMVGVADGVRLRVTHWPGRGDALPYILVHGLSSNARLWSEVADHLSAAGHPVYAPDLRSHGESDAPSEGYDTATAAADIAAVARVLGVDRAVIVGQSWGGNVVVRLAAEQPDLVARLALVDGGWIDLPAQFATWEDAEAALRPPDLRGLRVADLTAYLRRSHPDWSDTAIDATVANLRVGPDGSLSRRLAIGNHMRIVRSMWEDPPGPDFPRITAPVLLLPAIPNDPEAAAQRRISVDKAVAALARPSVREFVGADHDIHAQHPAALAAELLTLGRERL